MLFPYTDHNGTEMAERPIGQDAIDLMQKAREQILGELSQVIVGQQDVVEQILISMFSRGHCLLEGVPGTRQDVDDQHDRQDVELEFLADSVYA